MKNFILLLIVPFLTLGQNMCDGVTTVLETFNTSTIDIVISTENSPDFWCSYCGLVLRDNDKNIIAIENPYNGGSFYGLAGGYSELRTLEIINNIELPFEGVLHAMNGLMPNVLVDENFIVDPENPIDMIDGDIPFTMCSWPLIISNLNVIELSNNKSLIKRIDILGRDKNQKGFKIEIYDDGSVEKKYVIE